MVGRWLHSPAGGGRPTAGRSAAIVASKIVAGPAPVGRRPRPEWSAADCTTPLAERRTTAGEDAVGQTSRYRGRMPARSSRRIALVVAAASGLVPGAIADAAGAGTASPGSGSAVRVAAARDDASPYAGLGAWIDIYDVSVRRMPITSVRSLSLRGVRTLYLETGNSAQTTAIYGPATDGAFVDEAHRLGMRVVAWYLPSLVRPDRDLRRARAAIAFTTASGGRFDSFALDIESSSVRAVAERNRRLLRLSRGLRSSSGAGYPLGAIIPSPRGMQLAPKYWPRFPYRALGGLYDAFLPMVYSSYRVAGAPQTYAYTAASIEILRAGTGRPAVPIHLIGGISAALDGAERQAVVAAATAERVAGLSLYGLMPDATAGWSEIAATSAAGPPAGG